jgi:hypothetical protein
MNITESKLQQIILEEVRLRLLNEILEEEIFGVLFEGDEDDVIEQWKTSESFREKVKNALRNFDELPSLKKKTVIMILGALGAFGTQLAGEFAHDAQKGEIKSQLAQQKKDIEDEYFGSMEDVRHFRDAATAEGIIIDVDDAEGIEGAKKKFLAKGAEVAPIIADNAIALRTGTNHFVYTPADSIADDEMLPFVGMTKASWEQLVRHWLTDREGRKRLEKFTGTSGKTQATFWAYASDNQLFSLADDGGEYMWLPPEWSVAYDVIQKNKARAGNQPSPESELNLSPDSGVGVWKESLEKYLTLLA